jgi:type I restriction enzyme M protein
MREIQDLRDDIINLVGLKEDEKLSIGLLRTILNDNNNHFIDKYMELIDHDTERDYIMDVYSGFFADRENLSQDYTPQSLGRLLGKMALEQDEDINTVFDLCCGSGSLTLEFWKQKKDVQFYMLELDENVIPFLLLNLMIRGINADVVNGNGLTMEFFHIYKVRNNGKYSTIEEIDKDNYKIPICDVAISNPPFNVRHKDKNDYSYYCGYQQKSYADALFAIRCLEQVKENGKVYYITFPGTAYHNDDTMLFRKWCIESEKLWGIIRMPEKFFENTSISVDLWVFDKDKKSNGVVETNEFVFVNNTEQNYTKDFFTRYKRGTFGGKCHENRVYEKKFNGLSDENINTIIDSFYSGSSHLRNYIYKTKKEEMDNNFNFSLFFSESIFDNSEFDGTKAPTEKQLKELRNLIKDAVETFGDDRFIEAFEEEYNTCKSTNNYKQLYKDCRLLSANLWLLEFKKKSNRF